MISDALQLPVRYLAWHYSRAIAESLRLWATAFRFVTRLCAVPLHLRTLFAPFERLAEPAHGSIGDRFEAVVVSLMMRLVGFVMRLGVLALALVAYAGVTVLGFAALVAWLLLPAALCLSLWVGARGLLVGEFK